MNTRLIVLICLVAAVVGSATAVVYSKHRSRTLFAELQSLNRDRDQLNVAWERLQLEQGTWTTHGRIERLARQELNMRPPARDEVVMLYQGSVPELELQWQTQPEGGRPDGR